MSVGACLRLPSAPQDAKVGNRAKKGNEPGYPMTRKSGRTRPAEPKEMLPPDLQLLLEEIEKDPSIVYGPDRGPIGSPATVREFLRGYEESGVDELILLLTPRRHEETMESIELMGKEVLPEFIEREEKAAAEADQATSG